MEVPALAAPAGPAADPSQVHKRARAFLAGLGFSEHRVAAALRAMGGGPEATGAEMGPEEAEEE